MSQVPSFELAQAHVHFSAACFNAAWTLIEKPARTPAEDEEMIALNQASLWHWSQRADCTDRHRAIGYWQASRIRAILGQSDEAARYAALCLAESVSLSPFYRACAHEALARAAIVGGDRVAAEGHVVKIHAYLQAIDDPEEREIVVADLATLDGSSTS